MLAMKIIFEETDKNSKQLTIADVAENQFFVCSDGHLCQKQSSYRYTTITNEHGLLCCEIFDCDQDYKIKCILPKIAKIEF